MRKRTAHLTGWHGLLSGKPSSSSLKELQLNGTDMEDPKMGILRLRLAAIDRARQNIERITMVQNRSQKSPFLFWNRNQRDDVIESPSPTNEFVMHQTDSERLEERKRSQRVKEIDAIIQSAQKQLLQLACEKDVLQQRPNPLWNYTTSADEKVHNVERNKSHNDNPNQTNATNTDQEHSIPQSDRIFNFPSPDLVDEYLETLFITGRLIRMNQTELWRQSNDEDDEDIDALMTPPPLPSSQYSRINTNGNPSNTAAPWLLRNFLGEKIGEAVEIAAYKAVGTSLMTILAKSISNLHGVNVMGYADIRLSTEDETAIHNLPMGDVGGSSTPHKYRNYAQEAFQDAMRRGSRISAATKRGPYPFYPHNHDHHSSSTPFIQREAIVETLTSQCQMAAPLLNLFPLSLQRALISNIVILCTAIMADFFAGLEFQILGHRLSFSFQPITEEDMMKNMMRDHDSYHHTPAPRFRTDPDRFEAAVRATAEEVSMNLNILDRWHERALGSGVLRTQIATIIARLVLTLVDDILRAARMELWSTHAGGPKLSAALEYRRVIPTTA